MKLNLNNLSLALSHALDFMEIDLLGVVSNHSKRVSYIATRLGAELGLPDDELFDLVTLAILHDNGMGAAFLAIKGGEPRTQSPGRAALSGMDAGPAHCIAGEDNIAGYPLRSDAKDILLYHHENWNGSGFFRLAGDAIPVMSQIIHLADLVELSSDLRNIDYAGKRKTIEFVSERAGSILSPTLAAAFEDLSTSPAFWLDLQDEFVGPALHRRAPRFDAEMGWSQVREVTAIFSRIIDSKSRFTSLHSQELSERAGAMAAFYKFDAETTDKLRIAADLHDVGKLAVSNAILDKPGKLDPPEIDVIQRHTYYTRVSLDSIAGFEDITEWAANHHEKLDGSGYPFGKDGRDLDFNSRLLACLDIYQALTEVRPYREALSHETTMGILRGMASAGKIEAAIVADLDKAFRPKP